MCPIFGIFSPIKNFTNSDELDELMYEDDVQPESKQVCFIPSPLLESNELFSYEPKRPFNVPYRAPDLIKTTNMFKAGTIERVPFSLVSKMADTSEATIMYILKQVVMAIEHTMETGYTSKLNLRIGSLRFAQGKF